MNKQITSRILAAIILGIIFGGAYYLRVDRRVRAGQTAFLAEQKLNWETIYVHPGQVDRQIASVVILFLLLVFVYECLSFGLDQLVRRLKRDDQR